jgi:hypothetical protein
MDLNNISDLTAVNNKINNLSTLQLKHLAQVNSTPENLSTCIESLKEGLNIENVTYTRGIDGKKYKLSHMLGWMVLYETTGRQLMVTLLHFLIFHHKLLNFFLKYFFLLSNTLSYVINKVFYLF